MGGWAGGRVGRSGVEKLGNFLLLASIGGLPTGLSNWLPGRCCCSLQGHFLQTYSERAAALAAEVDALKLQQREAHRRVRAAEAKMRSLEDGLREARAKKEVGAGGAGTPRWGTLPAPTPRHR